VRLTFPSRPDCLQLKLVFGPRNCFRADAKVQWHHRSIPMENISELFAKRDAHHSWLSYLFTSSTIIGDALLQWVNETMVSATAIRLHDTGDQRWRATLVPGTDGTPQMELHDIPMERGSTSYMKLLVQAVSSPPPKDRIDRIEVYFSPKQVSHPATSSPSPRKPTLIMEDWGYRNFPIRVKEPLPATAMQLLEAHSARYIDGVLSCTLPNGFGGRQLEVAASLPWTCGSFLSAARGALANGLVACSPTSGFHHAGTDSAHGYCTFNGLMVAALVLKSEGQVQRVGILDCDQHYGDGTQEIIDRQGIDWIDHISHEYTRPSEAEPFLAQLANAVRRFGGCDLLMYQAGADPHREDPLGGFLTTEQLARRDFIVFSVAKQMGLPVVWNLAGGYQDPIERVLDIHSNTLRACMAVYMRPRLPLL
jgi:acetoin utilization deacetylase AcuC-like enzyme